MRFLHAQPVLRQVVILAAVLIVLLSLAIAWSGNRTRRERADEVEREAGAMAATAAATLNGYFTNLDALAAILLRHPAVRALDGDVCKALLADILPGQPLVKDVRLRAQDGRLVAAAVHAAIPEPAPPRIVFDIINTGRPAASPIDGGPVTGPQTFFVGYPVRGDRGSIVGVLGVILNPARLEGFLAGLSLPADSAVALVDRDGRVVARSGDDQQHIGPPSDTGPREPSAVPRTFRRVDADGVERFYGNAVVDRGPWLLSVAIPQSEVLARVAPIWRRNLAIVGLFSAFVLVLAVCASEMLAADVKELRDAAQRIAGGDLSSPAQRYVANRELAELQDAFAVMAARLRDTRDALDRQIEQERRTREMLQSLQRQVVRQERLAAVGLLVSGVAHELNNPLQAIMGALELLEQRTDLHGDVTEELAFVKTQSGRAREIIRNLSRFSSQQSGPPALVDLRDVIKEIVQLRKRDLDVSSIALDIEASSLRKVYASFTELEQVTLNFVINAQQAIETSGRAAGRILIQVTDAGKRVRLEVRDNGPGVRPDDEPKLFQPFFTTKPVGKGTGLGLSVSYGIIDSYGGAIGYHPNEWGGATFFFELPAADSEPVDSQATNDRTAVLRRPLLPRV